MTGQILKVVDISKPNKPTVYIFFPENILDLVDTVKGCEIRYSSEINIDVVVENVTARQMKRSIQEQLKEDHNLGFLKLESTYNGHKGLRYINVKHIAGVIDEGNKDCYLQPEYHQRQIQVQERAQDVAAQIRRVIKRLDQDQDLCCQIETETETETE